MLGTIFQEASKLHIVAASLVSLGLLPSVLKDTMFKMNKNRSLSNSSHL